MSAMVSSTDWDSEHIELMRSYISSQQEKLKISILLFFIART